jgi:hypothetical protein
MAAFQKPINIVLELPMALNQGSVSQLLAIRQKYTWLVTLTLKKCLGQTCDMSLGLFSIFFL